MPASSARSTEVADQMEQWFKEGACDGFNFLAPVFPVGLNDFVDLVVPELQRRGLYRTAYEGPTLRDILGLPVPQSRYARGSAARTRRRPTRDGGPQRRPIRQAPRLSA